MKLDPSLVARVETPDSKITSISQLFLKGTRVGMAYLYIAQVEIVKRQSPQVRCRPHKWVRAYSK